MENEVKKGVEREKNESTVDYLTRLKEMGFLFHGSGRPQKIEKLEPRKANDLKGNEWNSDTAVYASGEPVWSAIFAIYKGKEPWATGTHYSTDTGFEVTARIPERYKEEMRQWQGWVYVLSADSFENQGNHSQQYKSREVVSPLTAVEVTLQDYYDMGGKIEWT